MPNGFDANADPQENPEPIKNLFDNPIVVHGETRGYPRVFPRNCLPAPMMRL